MNTKKWGWKFWQNKPISYDAIMSATEQSIKDTNEYLKALRHGN